ncbi:hypothetical protein ALC56_02627 [Trachymyrmex septentrionalis]|uniref:Uncharacterized protein n=1 Tax=Trachymyrmex septentrionalis TaxID=34720 RepID=A0A195FQH2_9HYME|nr:hypothetical protein ALC56_02627 [Trachymyrmex septentrionalis]
MMLVSKELSGCSRRLRIGNGSIRVRESAYCYGLFDSHCKRKASDRNDVYDPDVNDIDPFRGFPCLPKPHGHAADSSSQIKRHFAEIGIDAARNVDSCRLGAAARFLRALVPKRGATPPKPGGVGGQINTRYFTGWEMKVCFVPCLQARPRN